MNNRVAIQTVVVPLDGSALAESALGPARAVAAATGASLRLVTTRWDDNAESARRYLRQQAEQVAGVRVDTVVIMDRQAADAILLEAQAPGTVVCMATHGRGGLRQAVLGSVAESVLCRSEHPLLLVGPHLQTRLSALEPANLLLAVDGSETSEAVLPAAAEWAKALALSVHVVQVLVPPVGLAVPPGEQRAADYIASLVARLRDLGVSAYGKALHGPEPGGVIADHARSLSATLIAMATHGRTGLARVALGSVAMRVVHDSPCPLLLARPSPLPR